MFAYLRVQFPEVHSTATDSMSANQMQYALLLALLAGLTNRQNEATFTTNAAELVEHAALAFPVDSGSFVLEPAVAALNKDGNFKGPVLAGMHWMINMLVSDSIVLPSIDSRLELVPAFLALRDVTLMAAYAPDTESGSGKDNRQIARATLAFRSLHAHYTSPTALPVVEGTLQILKRMLQVSGRVVQHVPLCMQLSVANNHAVVLSPRYLMEPQSPKTLPLASARSQ